MSGIRVNEWLHNSGTGGIWQTSAGNVGIASSVPTAKLVVTGDANVSGAVTATSFNGGQLGNRNLIINGAMNVAQRGSSSTTADYGTVDRIKLSYSGHDEALTQTQHALTSSDTGPWEEGFRYSFHLQNGNQSSGAGAADQAIFETRLEAQDMATCGWNYTSAASNITLSFWVKSSVSQTFYGVLETQDGTGQNYPYSFDASSTWTKITKTIPGNSNIQFDMNSNNGIQIEFHPFMGTNFTDNSVSLNTWAAAASGTRHPDMTSTWWTTDDSTFEITGLQLEVGSHATPFEHRSYADDLRRCYRYYRRLTASSNYEFVTMGDVDNDGTNLWMLIQFNDIPFRANIASIETTGTAGDYAVRRDTTKTCTSVPVINTNPTAWNCGMTWYSTSHGWATGDSAKAYIKSSGAYIGFVCEL